VVKGEGSDTEYDDVVSEEAVDVGVTENIKADTGEKAERTHGGDATASPPPKYNITYELNGGTNSTNNKKEYTKGTKITLGNPSKQYVFMGWTNSEGNVITEIPASTVGDVFLIANWELPKVSITDTIITKHQLGELETTITKQQGEINEKKNEIDRLKENIIYYSVFACMVGLLIGGFVVWLILFTKNRKKKGSNEDNKLPTKEEQAEFDKYGGYAGILSEVKRQNEQIKILTNEIEKLKKAPDSAPLVISSTTTEQLRITELESKLPTKEEQAEFDKYGGYAGILSEVKRQNEQIEILTNEIEKLKKVPDPDPKPEDSKILYADFINDNFFDNVTNEPNPDTVFELTLDKKGKAVFTVFEEVYAKVLRNPDYLEGCEKQIGQNRNEIVINKGDEGAAKLDNNNRWKITKPLKVKIV